MESVPRISFGFGSTFPANDKGFVVHGHQLLKDGEITCRVLSGRQQAAEDAGLVQNERFATLPIAPKSRECLVRCLPSAPCRLRPRASAPAAAVQSVLVHL